jgi:hypothetical protein
VNNKSSGIFVSKYCNVHCRFDLSGDFDTTAVVLLNFKLSLITALVSLVADAVTTSMFTSSVESDRNSPKFPYQLLNGSSLRLAPGKPL